MRRQNWGFSWATDASATNEKGKTMSIYREDCAAYQAHHVADNRPTYGRQNIQTTELGGFESIEEAKAAARSEAGRVKRFVPAEGLRLQRYEATERHFEATLATHSKAQWQARISADEYAQQGISPSCFGNDPDRIYLAQVRCVIEEDEWIEIVVTRYKWVSPLGRLTIGTGIRQIRSSAAPIDGVVLTEKQYREIGE